MSGRDAMDLKPLVTERDYTSPSFDSYDPAAIFEAPIWRGPLELSAQLQDDAPTDAQYGVPASIYSPIPTAPYMALPPPSQLQPPPPTDCQCALSALRECFIEALHWASDVLARLSGRKGCGPMASLTPTTSGSVSMLGEDHIAPSSTLLNDSTAFSFPRRT